jgi:hypothetical protein
VRAPDLASVHTQNELRVAEANIERADDGFHAFLQSASRALQGSPLARFLSSRNRAFWVGLSASSRTAGALIATAGRRRDRPPRYRPHTWSLPRTPCVPVAASATPFPIGVVPEVSPLTPMSTAGAGSRGIAAAKETCSGTNQEESCLSSRLCRVALDVFVALVNTRSAACSCSSRTDLGDERRALQAITAS